MKWQIPLGTKYYFLCRFWKILTSILETELHENKKLMI